MSESTHDYSQRAGSFYALQNKAKGATDELVLSAVGERASRERLAPTVPQTGMLPRWRRDLQVCSGS